MVLTLLLSIGLNNIYNFGRCERLIKREKSKYIYKTRTRCCSYAWGDGVCVVLERICVMDRYVIDRNLITAQGYAFVDFTVEVCRYLNIFESEQQEYEQVGKVKES